MIDNVSMADGGAEGGDFRGLDKERQGVEVVVMAAVLGDEEGHGLMSAELILGGGALAEQLAAGVVGGGIG
jgi:hypothetical protein